MKVIITGGGGFLGSQLCQKLLEDGIEQHDLANFFRTAGRPGECASPEEFLAKLRAEEAASACDDDLHAGSRNVICKTRRAGV